MKKEYFVKIYDEDGDSTLYGEYETEKQAIEARDKLKIAGFDYVAAYKYNVVETEVK